MHPRCNDANDAMKRDWAAMSTGTVGQSTSHSALSVLNTKIWFGCARRYSHTGGACARTSNFESCEVGNFANVYNLRPARQLVSHRPDFLAPWAVSSVVEHCLHTAGVTGSNPVPPTKFPSIPQAVDLAYVPVSVASVDCATSFQPHTLRPSREELMSPP